MFKTYHFRKGKKFMLENLFEKKKKIEFEIFCIECADYLLPEEKFKLNSLNKELANIRFQIEKEKP